MYDGKIVHDGFTQVVRLLLDAYEPVFFIIIIFFLFFVYYYLVLFLFVFFSPPIMEDRARARPRLIYL